MDQTFALKYDELEQKHWWFKARREILHKILNRFINWQACNNAVEVGTSSGNNLYHLYPPNINLYGVEPFAENVAIARDKGPVPVYKGRAEKLPDVISNLDFELITLFDVLEHTKDDLQVLRYLRSKLSGHGKLVISVPAYMWMWGHQDEISHHYRRYTLAELVHKLEKTGYTINYKSYFNTFLFIPVAIIRLLARFKSSQKNGEEFGDFKIGPKFLNDILFSVFRTEKYLLPHIQFPFGVSIIIVASKN